MTICRPICVALWVGLLVALASPAAAQDIPPLTGRVVDQAEVISPKVEERLTSLLAEHEAATSNQVAVLTVPTLDGEPIEDYALEVGRSWALGTESFDNGVLVLVAPDDREARIEVGYGLEGTLPDALAGRILRHEMVPRFREGNYEAGIEAGVLAVLGSIEGTYEPPARSRSGGDQAGGVVFGLIFLAFSSFFAMMGVLTAGCGRWFMFVFLIPFFAGGGAAMTNSGWGALLIVALYIVAYIGLSMHPGVKRTREAFRDAKKSGEKVRVGPFTFDPASMSSGGSSGGSSFSSGSSFSGGGGSFGGGGASASW